MRREGHVGQPEQGPVGRRRLHGEGLQPRARQVAISERPVERVVVHHRPARRVDEIGAALHAAELALADEAARLRVTRACRLTMSDSASRASMS